jgi:aminobenzoyl-glutamate utilization protein B
MNLRRIAPIVAATCVLAVPSAYGQRGGGAAPPQPPSVQLAPPSDKTEALKKEVVADVESRRVFTQQLVDQLFSYSELGFQETETQRKLTDTLVREGFDVQRSVAGVPTAWIARYGTGHPIIALGTDIDGLPSTNQTPGVLTRKELVEGAPGHGEGHNAGQALIITAALAVKKVMDRDKLPGTLLLWPGVAEEALGTKAQFVRAGVFKDVDATLFAHVSHEFGISYGDESALTLISALFKFKGASAHAAAAPWRGKSALDAVMLFGQSWEYKREHMETAQRSHYIISDGGDQPNVVPSTAKIGRASCRERV